MDHADISAASTARPARWPWLCLAAALIWVALIRVPLVLNAEVHLDSDLAVDGLTLRDATHGHLRWHFPGTPYMGIGPILLSLPGALLFGVNASTLVVGGVVAYELFVLATFLLVRRLFGPVAAVGALVPLAFASVGTVWLSGRLTGGHLLTLAWHAATLAMVPTFGRAGGYLRAFLFGVWCGLGYYLDGMFAVTLPFVGVLAATSVSRNSELGRALCLTMVMVLGFVLGELPREVGSRVDPHDAYKEQFTTIFDHDDRVPVDRGRVKSLFLGHLSLFSLECLPRLVAGHRLVAADLPTEPRPEAMAGGTSSPIARAASPALAAATVAVSGLLFAAALIALVWAGFSPRRGPKSATAEVPAGWCLAMLGSSALVGAMFLVNKNIYNSDNYRYLVYMLLPWSAGFGLMMAGLWRRGVGGRVAAALLSGMLAVLFTLDTASWYRGFGWLDEASRPIRRRTQDPALDFLLAHPEVDAIFGGYWDVYRYRFLVGDRLAVLPFPDYPDRFDDADGFPSRQPRVLVARQGQPDDFYREMALREGGKILFRGRDRLIIDWPRTR